LKVKYFTRVAIVAAVVPYLDLRFSDGLTRMTRMHGYPQVGALASVYAASSSQAGIDWNVSCESVRACMYVRLSTVKPTSTFQNAHLKNVAGVLDERSDRVV